MSGADVSDKGEGTAGRAVSVAARIERLIGHAANVICDPASPLDHLPKQIARMAPDAPVLELSLVLASAAEATQAVLRGNGESARRAQRVWQQAAMVAVEVHFLAVSGKPHACAADLLAHWQHEEKAK